MNQPFETIGTRPPRVDAIDKVTGKALFGDDIQLQNALVGLVLRSPHAHANILSIDTRRAEKVPGVKAVITANDFPELRPGGAGDIAKDNLARSKVLYHGHGVAAVAASNLAAAKQALKLIKVKYEVLQPVISIEEAMHKDAPLLHDHLSIDDGRPSNIYEHAHSSIGDVETGFKEADIVLEREYRTPTVHQGYIEPTAWQPSMSPMDNPPSGPPPRDTFRYGILLPSCAAYKRTS